MYENCLAVFASEGWGGIGDFKERGSAIAHEIQQFKPYRHPGLEPGDE